MRICEPNRSALCSSVRAQIKLRKLLVVVPIVAGTLLLVFPVRLLAAGEQPFATPEAAVSALDIAAKNRDSNALCGNMRDGCAAPRAAMMGCIGRCGRAMSRVL